MKSLKMRVHYLTIGVRDACRLWHIRAIALLVIVSLAGYITVAIINRAGIYNCFLKTPVNAFLSPLCHQADQP